MPIISEKMKGNTNGSGNKGRKHSEETKRKISENRKGKCMGNKNKYGKELQ